MKRRIMIFFTVLASAANAFAGQEPAVIRGYYSFLNEYGETGVACDPTKAATVFAQDYHAFETTWGEHWIDPKQIVNSHQDLLDRLSRLKSTYKGWTLRKTRSYQGSNGAWMIESQWFPNTGEVFYINAQIFTDELGLIVKIVEEVLRQMS